MHAAKAAVVVGGVIESGIPVEREQCSVAGNHQVLVNLWRQSASSPALLYVCRFPGAVRARFLSSSRCVIRAQKEPRIPFRSTWELKISAVCSHWWASPFSPITLLTQPRTSVAYHVKVSQLLSLPVWEMPNLCFSPLLTSFFMLIICLFTLWLLGSIFLILISLLMQRTLRFSLGYER